MTDIKTVLDQIQAEHDKPWDERNWREKSYACSVFPKPPPGSITYFDKAEGDGIYAVPAGRDGETTIWHAYFFDNSVWRCIGFEHKPIQYIGCADSALADAKAAREEAQSVQG